MFITDYEEAFVLHGTEIFERGDGTEIEDIMDKR
jgi:hypothetical protein